MITPSDLSWDDIVRVGPGTLGGNYLRRFWWPIALSEEVKDIPVPVKALGEELVLFRAISGHPTLLGRYCSHRRASLGTEESNTKVSVAPTTAGATTGKEKSSIVQPNLSRPRPTSSIRGIALKN
jgi:hypothetical protein